MGEARKDVKRGFLVWDKGFLPRLLLSLVVLFCGLGAAQRNPSAQFLAWELYQEVLLRLMDGAHRMAWWSVIGLLSSSCCALQLMLNALNFGCAGFNTVLGPVRPSLVALTVVLQGIVWRTALDKPFQWLYVAPATIVAFVLTFLPEITYLLVQRKRSSETTSGTAEVKFRVEVAINGMGCVACTKKVAEVLDRRPEVRNRLVELEEKRAYADLALSREQAEELVPKVLEDLAVACFQAELVGLTEVAPAEPKPAEQRPADATGNCKPEKMSLWSLSGAAGWPLSIATGLLTSSCCLLQLGVNLLATLNLAHVGCAGFNKVLGPWRWHLRVVTGAWLASSWAVCLHRGWNRQAQRRLLLRTTLCVVLMFLPEILLMAGGPALAPPVDGAEVLNLKVDGMGCEACQMHVQGIIDRQGGVVASNVDWSSGQARITVNKGWNFDLPSIVRLLEKDGYSAKLHTDL